MARTRSPDTYARIYRVVRRIPRGRVATYGQVARLAGLPGHARLVGYALSALEDDGVPWQRVINARGEVSPRSMRSFSSGHARDAESLQRRLLEREGVRFDSRGRIRLERYRWRRGVEA